MWTPVPAQQYASFGALCVHSPQGGCWFIEICQVSCLKAAPTPTPQQLPLAFPAAWEDTHRGSIAFKGKSMPTKAMFLLCNKQRGAVDPSCLSHDVSKDISGVPLFSHSFVFHPHFNEAFLVPAFHATHCVPIIHIQSCMCECAYTDTLTCTQCANVLWHMRWPILFPPAPPHHQENEM